MRNLVVGGDRHNMDCESRRDEHAEGFLRINSGILL